MIGAGDRRVQQHAVFATRDHVDLARERRDPEAVDHVGARRDDVHPSVHRDVNLVRRHRTRFRVAHLPPPLMADDVDRQPSAARGRRGAAADHIQVRCREQRDQHDERNGNPEQHDHPPRDVLALAHERQPADPAPDECEAQQPERAEEHDRGGPEHPPPQQRDEVRLGAAGRDDRTRAAAPCEQKRHAERSERETVAPRTAVPRRGHSSPPDADTQVAAARYRAASAPFSHVALTDPDRVVAGGRRVS